MAQSILVSILGHSDLAFEGKRLREQSKVFGGADKTSDRELYTNATVMLEDETASFSTPILDALIAHTGGQRDIAALHLIVTDQRNAHADTDTIHALPLITQVLKAHYPWLQVVPHVCQHPLDRQDLWLQWIRSLLCSLAPLGLPVTLSLTAGPPKIGALAFATRQLVAAPEIRLVETPRGPDGGTQVVASTQVPLDAAVTVRRLLADAATRCDYGRMEAALNSLESPVVRPLAQFARKLDELQRMDMGAVVGQDPPAAALLPEELHGDREIVFEMRLAYMRMQKLPQDRPLETRELKWLQEGSLVVGVLLREAALAALTWKDAALFATLCCAANEKAILVAASTTYGWALLGDWTRAKKPKILGACFRNGLLDRTRTFESLLSSAQPQAQQIKKLAAQCGLEVLRELRNGSYFEHGVNSLSLAQIEAKTGAKRQSIVDRTFEMFLASVPNPSAKISGFSAQGCAQRLVAAFESLIPTLLNPAR